MLKWDLCLWGPRLKQNSQIFLFAYIIVYINVNVNTDIVFLGCFVTAVPFILPTVHRSSVGSFVEREFFIRILFQVYFDFA